MFGYKYGKKQPPHESEHYEKFLDLWRDADSGIAEVEDVKKKLAGLKQKNISSNMA